jgi:RNA polymerase sigma-70 factor (ECF subfamily)
MHNSDKRNQFEKLSIPIMLDLYKHIKFIVKSPSLADDVFQNSLMIAFEKLESLRDESKFKPWIFKIATNECFSVLRKGKKEMPFEEFFDSTEDLYDFDTAELLTLLKEDKMAVMKAVGNLSYEQRRLIIMIYYLELNYKEISGLLKVPVNTLRVHHHRIIKKLRKMLKGEINEE